MSIEHHVYRLVLFASDVQSDDQVHSSEPVSRSSDDYDTRFEQYIEPIRRGSNLSVRYIQQPSANVRKSAAHFHR